MKYLNIFTAYVIGVLVVWAVIIAAGFSSRVALAGHPILHVFGGFSTWHALHVFCDASLSFLTAINDCNCYSSYTMNWLFAEERGKMKNFKN